MPCCPELIVILGPTASGKTAAAVRVAQETGGEIISADSRQVFRGMDIGTGKDLHEYGSVPYHLIDILAPGEEFSLFHYLKRFSLAFQDITSRGRTPVLAGGTGLYLDAILRGYQLAEVPPDPVLRHELEAAPMPELQRRLLELVPNLHNTTDLLDRDRTIRAIEIAMAAPPAPAPERVPDAAVFGIRWEREILRHRITERLRQRMDAGLVDEVAALLDHGVSHETLHFYGLEYRYVSLFLQGQLNRNDLFQKLNSAIHDFAKKQESWFRRMERNGVAIRWVEGASDPAAAILGSLHDLP